MRGMTATIALMLGLPVLCFAGRPVFHTLSMQDLAAASDAIVLVEKATPFAGDVKGAYGCTRNLWRVRIERVIKTSSAFAALAPTKQTLVVFRNPTGFAGCVYSEGGKTSGVSYSATRYQPTQPVEVADQDAFIVFLAVRQGVIELTTENAVESAAAAASIRKMIP